MHIESDGDRPRNVSLQALGEGRRIAATLGATVYAHAVLDHPSAESEAAWLAHLSRAGADRVVFSRADETPEPARWDGHGQLLRALSAQLEPALVLLAATHAGRDIAPRLAASLNADLVCQPEVSLDEPGEVMLKCALPDRGKLRCIPVADLAPGSVVTLTPHPGHAGIAGAGKARMTRVDMLGLEIPAARAGFEYLESVEDPGGCLDHARVIVTAGAGVTSDANHALVVELARALGGELAATEHRHALGLAPAERVIGRGVRHVAPRLYVVCAASGSRAHLDAVDRQARIVAIDHDPQAPVFQAASYGIVGRLEDVIPRLLEGLAASSPAPDPVAEPKEDVSP